MKRIPTTFAPYVFLPSRGVVRLVVSTTSSDAETAEIQDVLLHPEEGADVSFCVLDPDEQRRADEVASDALETICARADEGNTEFWKVSDRVEEETRKLADAAEGRWRDRWVHPHDLCGPSWHEHA